MHQQIFHKFTFKFHDHRNGIAVKNHWLVGNQKEVNSKKHGIAITILFEVPRKKTWKKKTYLPSIQKKNAKPENPGPTYRMVMFQMDVGKILQGTKASKYYLKRNST